ncbi:MAG: ABC transporter permease [Pyrinomonadaceae bacterium]|nr:ABC transporter permease [Pyrinomonadaceae bacterium]
MSQQPPSEIEKIPTRNPNESLDKAPTLAPPSTVAAQQKINTPEAIAADQLYGTAPPSNELWQETAGGQLEGTSLWRDAWRRLKKNKFAMLGLIVTGIIIVASLLGPTLLRIATKGTHTYDFIPQQGELVRAMPPSLNHPMGTDPQGRDMLARVLYGGQISLMVGLVSTFVSLLIGVAYGATAGYLGGRVDNLMMRIVDVLFAIPYMMLVIVLLALFEKSLVLLFAALGAISWLTMARIVRGQVLSLKNQEFVEAARSIGVPTWKIILRHLVPNTLGPVIVYATLTVPSVMLQEAFLSYLGLGVQAPRSSWGTLAAEGAQNIAIFPWLIIFPGIVMALTLFSLNFVGDGLRDALDPQMRKV